MRGIPLSVSSISLRLTDGISKTEGYVGYYHARLTNGIRQTEEFVGCFYRTVP